MRQALPARADLGVDLERTRRELIAIQEARSTIGPLGRRVVDEFAKLPLELQLSLVQTGVGFGDLPESMQEAVQILLDASLHGEPRVRIDLAAAAIRFRTEQIAGLTQHTLIAEAAVSIAYIQKNA